MSEASAAGGATGITSINEVEMRQRNSPKGEGGYDAAEAFRLRRRRFQTHRALPPPKTTLAAALMLVVGTTLLSLGLYAVFHGDKERGLSLCVLGALLFIPGSYAATVIWGAYNGWRGYAYHDIASYDDDVDNSI
mmetsp:Transcript_25582/g.80066  ORF Transcript_25582/g.80066 Transcript_25582/m.80066 type:complete len:135 (+) Transcript_25582:123-527(+)